MQRRIFLWGGLLGLAACGGRLNPVNWFAKRPPKVTEDPAIVPAVDPRGLVARVSDVTVEEVSSGVILRAIGTEASLGHYDAALVGLPLGEDGIKVFEFRRAAPVVPVAGRGPQKIAVAVAISPYQLNQFKAIRIVAAENAMVVSP